MSSGEIRIFRTTSGQEVIAEIVEQTDTHSVVLNPMMILMNMSAHDQIGIQLAPWLPLAKEKQFTIENQFIELVYSPNDQLKEKYTGFFSSIIKPKFTGSQLLKG